ncbi:MAG TPA: hypothetical protein VHY59_08905, partial [Chthoniobacterales bacterium]|nr:hypothetical protein [Chthoniobacterales bacterium]
GIGMFCSVPGAQTYGNIVLNNDIHGNGETGIAMHSHTPNQNLTNNVIVGNHVSGNGADSGDAKTPGPTGINVFGVSPVTGTVISDNIISEEDDDVVANTPALVTVHYNDLLGGKTGVNNLGSGSVDATENWWGCAEGPTKRGCSVVQGANISSTPWLTHSTLEALPPFPPANR